MLNWKSCAAGVGLLAMTSLAVADNKVLLIGIDGLQLEQVQRLNTPNFDRLNITKAYTGGIQGASSEQPTISGPGWATILTGVWLSKHGVNSNDAGLANPEFPGLFKRVKDANPDAYVASIANWAPINTNFFANEVANIDEVVSGVNDEEVVNRALQTLSQTPADFVFLHLDDPDHAGHASCFGSAYDKAVQDSDRRLGQLLDKVANLQNQNADNWLVLVTTDHGRTPIVGCGHGNQTEPEKTIFIGSNQPMNAEFSQQVTDIPNTEFNSLYGYPSQASIAPTVLRHLGVTIDASWRLDGLPLIGDLGVRKLMEDGSTAQRFTWYTDEQKPANIYRNGELVDQVYSMDRGWSDPDMTAAGVTDYVVEINSTPLALRLNNFQIDAALSKDAFKAYFFRNDQQYVRYDKVLDKSDGGYPKAVNNQTWPGMETYRDLITASFQKDAGTSYYFLKNGQYINYDNIGDKVRSGYPKPINNATWPGLEPYKDQIEAALRWHNQKVYFFLSNGDYIRYDINSDAVDSGYPKPINDNTWPGLGSYAKEITAAVKWSDSRGYIFLTGQRYLRYNISQDKVDDGYPKPVNSSTWPGLLNP
ncbi:hemopexin repeat-containing protein [Hahella sp. CR1]|uniref:hemopexin repeat-containing protein n=1 Tax=Hahella sp. CR1 TaxID=2992807 RepID=UPI0024413ACE|nr:hemopexin repeat-containing protein [Hahella sp. CR1]MDG9669321.1 hemopexin repeat-containing protein [Hahella sp. CR1]